MEIVLLKNHNGQKRGSKHDVSADAANYLVRTGVAEYADNANAPVNAATAPKKAKAPKQNKQVKPKLEQK